MPPVAFDPIPPAVTLNPVAGNPLCIMVVLMDVVAGNPDVAMSVPSPVTRVPDVISIRGRWDRLYPDRRRRDLDNNLLRRRLGGDGQNASGNDQSGENFGQL